MAGANSAASLASRPVRLVLLDEVDRFPPSAGTEGDPVKLAVKRSTTFWNRKVILTSTPTTKGASRIEAAWEESDQRVYEVPCPVCGGYQALAVGAGQVGEGRQGEPRRGPVRVRALRRAAYRAGQAPDDPQRPVGGDPPVDRADGGIPYQRAVFALVVLGRPSSRTSSRRRSGPRRCGCGSTPLWGRPGRRKG